MKYPDKLILGLGDIRVHFTKKYYDDRFYYEQIKNQNIFSISKKDFLLRLEALLMLGYEEVPVCLLCQREGTDKIIEKSKCDWSLMGTHHWILPSTGKDVHGVKQI